MLPLSLYIHIPWCIRKCPYCDFNSHAVRDSLPETEYTAKLLDDLQNHQEDWSNRSISSIFIGGGTPSLFSPASYKKLFTALNQTLQLEKDLEITLEANPGAADQERFLGYREAGINRLSLGVQSWDPVKLQSLGRIHNDEQAEKAIQMAKQAGFDNFNVDIMYGLPQQNLTEALNDLKKTISCRPTHISWYQLTLEPNTYFHRFPPKLPDEDSIWEIQQQGQQLLAAAGFNQYEVSAYCQNEMHSRHNLNYWLFGDYLGIGAGAHSKITDPKTGMITRYWKVKNPKDYLADKTLIEGKKQIESQELLLEFLMNGFRLNRKLSFTLITERTGLSKQTVLQKLNQLPHQELLSIDSESITTTALGRRFLNELLSSL